MSDGVAHLWEIATGEHRGKLGWRGVALERGLTLVERSIVDVLADRTVFTLDRPHGETHLDNGLRVQWSSAVVVLLEGDRALAAATLDPTRALAPASGSLGLTGGRVFDLETCEELVVPASHPPGLCGAVRSETSMISWSKGGSELWIWELSAWRH